MILRFLVSYLEEQIHAAQLVIMIWCLNLSMENTYGIVPE
jgi:hypothetical protein